MQIYKGGKGGCKYIKNGRGVAHIKEVRGDACRYIKEGTGLQIYKGGKGVADMKVGRGLQIQRR